jgi:hypothetical protein
VQDAREGRGDRSRGVVRGLKRVKDRNLILFFSPLAGSFLTGAATKEKRTERYCHISHFIQA